MKATSLSVNLWAPCNAKCPFCISRLTWKTGEHSNDLLIKALPKAFRYAKWHGVDTVLFTSNGEPTLAADEMLSALDIAASFGFPVIEVQTNGVALTDTHVLYVGDLVAAGLTTLAISVAHPDPFRNAGIMGLPADYNYLDVAREAVVQGLVVRVCLNLLAEHWPDDEYKEPKWAESYARWLAEAGVHQLTLRELGTPASVDESHRVPTWIRENEPSDHQVSWLAAHVRETGTVLRRLSYGNLVYEFGGLATTVATCMTEEPDPERIRSLILMPDGHVYHSWNHRGSILL